MHVERKYLIPALFVLILTAALLLIWYFTFPPPAWTSKPNYPIMYLEFVLTKPIDAFLIVRTGPGGVVAWVAMATYLLLAAHIILYVVGKRRKQQYTVMTRAYLVYLTVLALFAITFQNASQHYGWYWNPETDSPGYVDTWTHITSPWLLGALIAPFALERFLGWNRRLHWFPIFAILACMALIWEIAETMETHLDPTPGYFNYPMDSLKDMIMGAGIGTILTSWAYERLVTDRKKEPQESE